MFLLSEQVIAALTERGIPVKFVNAAEEFYSATTTIAGKVCNDAICINYYIHLLNTQTRLEISQ
jgi:hypothetical protein